MKPTFRRCAFLAVLVVAAASCGKEDETPAPTPAEPLPVEPVPAGPLPVEPTPASPSVVSLNVLVPPSQTEYALGERFNPAGMKVVAAYSDNSTRTLALTEDMLVYDFSTPGRGKRVLIVHGGQSTTVSDITVLSLAQRIAAVLGTTAELILYADEEMGPNGFSTDPQYSSGNVLPFDTHLTLKGSGGERKIIRTGDGSLFVIAAGASLTLADNLTIDGNGKSNTLLYVDGQEAMLTMKPGATLTRSHSDGYGGAVYVMQGTFNMEGGTISGNTANSGGGVMLYQGTFNMEGGTLSDNTAFSPNNPDSGNGGGVCIFQGTFTMSGGTLSGNTATRGHGVYVSSTGTFTMSGGSIPGDESGGDVFVAAYHYGPYTGQFRLSGNAQLNGVVLYADSASVRSTLQLPAAFSNGIRKLDLAGAAAVNTVQSWWEGQQVVKATSGNVNASQFPLGLFMGWGGSKAIEGLELKPNGNLEAP